ncbi:hypothetical protein D9M69_438850 [compost metagenome]
MAAVGQATLQCQQQALEAAAVFQLVEQFVADHPLRHAVDGAADDDRRRVLDRQVTGKRRLGHRAVGAHQEARTHGDAFGAVGQGRNQAPAVLETAGRHHGHRHRIDHLIQQHRGRHGAGMPTALAALYGHRIGAHFHGFLRMLERAHRGNAHHAGVLQATDHLLARRTAVADRPDFVAQHQLDDLAGIGLVHVEIHPERLIGQAPGFDNRRFHLLRFDGRPGQETETTSIARGRHQFRVGDPAHGGLDDRITAPEQLCQTGIQRDRHAHASPVLRWELAMALAS